ncbi:MAG: hypothetical protein JJE22_13670 [Bacteroidia bacterium]|nr:hypothetical protein [Bacteroidia bacterium]
MKKFITLGLSLVILSVAASAQQASGENFRRNRTTHKFSHDEIARPERHQLQKDRVRYKVAQHRARKDGHVGPLERRRLQNIRKHNRHDLYRFRHNRFHKHHRVI